MKIKYQLNKFFIVAILLVVSALSVKPALAAPGDLPGTVIGKDLLEAKDDLGWPVEQLTASSKIGSEYAFFVGTYPLVQQYKINDGEWKNFSTGNREVYTGKFTDSVTYANIGRSNDGKMVDVKITHNIPMTSTSGLGAYRWGISRNNALHINSGAMNQDNVITYTFLEHDTNIPIKNLKGHMTLGYALSANDIMLAKDSVDKIYIPPKDITINGINFKGSSLKYRTYDDPLTFENDYYNLTTGGIGGVNSQDTDLLTNYGVLLFSSNERGEYSMGKKFVPNPPLQYGTVFIPSSNFPAKVSAQDPIKNGFKNDTARGTVNYEIDQPLPNQLAGFYIDKLKVTDQLSPKLVGSKVEVVVKDRSGVDFSKHFTTTVDANNKITIEMIEKDNVTVMSKQRFGLIFSIKAPINSDEFEESDFVDLSGENYFKYEHDKAHTVIDEGTIFEEHHDTTIATSHTLWPSKVTLKGDQSSREITLGDDITLPFEWSEIDSTSSVDLFYEIDGVLETLKTGLDNTKPGEWNAAELELLSAKLKVGHNIIKIHAKNSKGLISNVLTIDVEVKLPLEAKLLTHYVDDKGKEIFPSTSKMVLIDTEYTTKQEDLSGAGYNFVKTTGDDPTGTMTLAGATVTYVYDIGKVIVKTNYLAKDKENNLTELFPQDEKTYLYSETYKTKSEEEAAKAEGYVLESSNTGDPITGNTGLENKTITVNYVFHKGVRELVKVPTLIDFGSHKLLTLGNAERYPTENIEVDILDEIPSDWVLNLKISETIVSKGSNKKLAGTFKFVREDGTSVQIGEGDQMVHKKKSNDKENINIEWDASAKKGLSYTQVPGEENDIYGGKFTWTLLSGP